MYKPLAIVATTFFLFHSGLSFAMSEAESQAVIKDFPGVFAKGTCNKLLPSLSSSTCECIGSKVAMHMAEKKGLLDCTQANMNICMEKVEGEALADVTQKDIDGCSSAVASSTSPQPSTTAPAVVTNPPATTDSKKLDSSSSN